MGTPPPFYFILRSKTLMDVPGRRSAASLTVAPVVAWARPEPPEGLTGPAAELWRAVAASKPAEWFAADTLPLLEVYCRTVTEHRRASAVLAATEPSDISAYKSLVDVVAKLSGSMASVATKLRLTPQSRYTPQAAGTAAKKAATIAKPWSA